MANENKQIEDVAADDDEPTAELEVLGAHHLAKANAEREVDAATYDFDRSTDAASDETTSMPRLQADLDDRSETISQLHHDIEQLHAKWLGLEKEMGTRDDIVKQLSAEAEDLAGQLVIKERQLLKSDDRIAALTSKLRKRDDSNATLEKRLVDLEQQLTERRAADADSAATIDSTQRDAEDLRGRLDAAHEEMSALKSEIEKRGEDNANLDNYRNELEQQLSEAAATLQEVQTNLQSTQGELDTARQEIAALNATVEKRAESLALLEKQHADLQQQHEDQDSLLRKTDSELQETHATLDAANSSIEDLNSRLQKRDAAYESLQKQHAERQREITELDELLQQLESNLQGTRSSLDTAENDIAKLNTELQQRDEANSLLQQQHADAQAEIADKIAAIESTQQTLQETRSELESARSEIGALNAEIAERDEAYRSSEARYTELSQKLDESLADLLSTEQQLAATQTQLETTREDAAAALAKSKQANDALVKETSAQLAGAEKYADTLRFKLQEFTDTQIQWSKERVRLADELQQLSERNKALESELQSATAAESDLQATIEQQQADHEQQIQSLQVELSEAQGTAVETDGQVEQLAADLNDAQESKAQLEHLLRQKETEAQDRVDELEKQVRSLSRTSDDLEQQLATKSAAINALLAELAKKTEQLESIGDMEQVIQDIDSRMSNRIDDRAEEAPPKEDVPDSSTDRDRTTRLLIGSFGDKELRFPLFKKQLTIGRVEENDIQLKTSYISRRHAHILTEGDVTRVIDANSKNGVFVNSKRVKDSALSNGDIVSIGNVKFRYEERPKRDA